MARVKRIQRTPTPKRCPICRKLVIKADFDGKNAKYAKVRGARRKQFRGQRWQHIDCKDLKTSSSEKSPSATAIA
jgi:hypothetical protein